MNRVREMACKADFAGRALEISVSRQHVMVVKLVKRAQDERGLPGSPGSKQDDAHARPQVSHHRCQFCLASNEVLVGNDLPKAEGREMVDHG
jgi:hypothetical protein